MPTPDFLAFLQQLLQSDEPASMAPEQPGVRAADIPLPVPPRDQMPPAWTPQLERQIWAKAEAMGINPIVADRLVRQESQYNPKAVSKKGAVGLTQLMPATAIEMGVTNREDPEQSLQGGFKYLKQLIARYHGNENKALMAYNLGPGNLAKALSATQPLKPDLSGGLRQAKTYAAIVGRRK